MQKNSHNQLLQYQVFEYEKKNTQEKKSTMRGKMSQPVITICRETSSSLQVRVTCQNVQEILKEKHRKEKIDAKLSTQQNSKSKHGPVAVQNTGELIQRLVSKGKRGFDDIDKLYKDEFFI